MNKLLIFLKTCLQISEKYFSGLFLEKKNTYQGKLLFKPYVDIQCITVILIDSDLVQNQCNKYFFCKKYQHEVYGGFKGFTLPMLRFRGAKVKWLPPKSS